MSSLGVLLPAGFRISDAPAELKYTYDSSPETQVSESAVQVVSLSPSFLVYLGDYRDYD